MGGALGRIRAAVADRINQTVVHDEIDADGDGKVSAEELAEQTGVTLERAKEIIAQYDKDGDAQLDEEEFEKLKQQLISEQMEAQALVAQISLHQEFSNAAAAGAMLNSKEFEDLKAEVADIMELLTAVLDQTPAGKRALKQREMEKEKENKGKSKRKKSSMIKSDK